MLVRELENSPGITDSGPTARARAPRQPLEVVVVGARELGAMRYELGAHTLDRRFVGPALIVTTRTVGSDGPSCGTSSRTPSSLRTSTMSYGG